MKNKVFIILGLFFLALTITGVVQAFTMANVDGVWDKINGTDSGATGQIWASGPLSGGDFNVPQHSTDSVAARITTQNQVLYDWNQVRYGSTSTFGSKSGFGFLGHQNIGDAPALNIPFNVGQFCHFNNEISANAPLDWVDLKVKITGIECEHPFILADPSQAEMTFDYRFNLTETSNNQGLCWPWEWGTGDCKCRTSLVTVYHACPFGPSSTNWPANGGSYCTSGQEAYNNPQPAPGQLNYNGCADRVNITKPGDTQYFTCVDNADPLNIITREYTVSLMGFINKPASGECPAAVPIGTDFSNNLVYTAEQTNNCYCAYAAITKEDITPVVMLDFAAEGVSTGIQLTWVTATEVNHLGFNVYRSEMEFGVKEKINNKIVVGDSNPGNPFGANYAYLDTTAEPGVTYFYWVEDVPSDTSYTPELFGPVSVARP